MVVDLFNLGLWTGDLHVTDSFADHKAGWQAGGIKILITSANLLTNKIIIISRDVVMAEYLSFIFPS